MSRNYQSNGWVEMRKLELPNRARMIRRVVHFLDEVWQIRLDSMRIHVEEFVVFAKAKIKYTQIITLKLVQTTSGIQV